MKFLSLALLLLQSSITFADPYNFESLKKTIEDGNIRTIEALLPLLPEGLKKNYTFVYQSRSAQSENVFPKWPRVILYGEDAKFIVAFTKNPSTPPVAEVDDTLETVEFNENDSRFIFRELVFDGKRNPLRNPIEENPQKCISCHRRNIRPNWDPYNMWPGVYGSLARFGCDTMQAGTNEMAFYQAFMKENRQKDRYAFLPKEVEDFKKCPKDPENEMTFRNAISTDPNSDLTQKLFELNSKRIGSYFFKHPEYDKFKFAIVAERRGCFNKNTIYPEKLLLEKEVPSNEEMEKSLAAKVDYEFQLRLARFQKNNKESLVPGRKPINFVTGKETSPNSLYAVARMKRISQLMDLNMQDWAMAFNQGMYDFTSPFTHPIHILIDVASHEKELEKLSCEELSAKSLEALLP